MAPPRLTKAELVTDWIQQRLLTERPSGFIPYFDSVYGGGGFTLGAGYRRAFADHSLWIVRGLYSAKQYKLIELDVVSSVASQGARDLWRHRRVARRHTGRLLRPRHGHGRSDRADFRFQQAFAQVTGMWRPSPWFRASATGGFEDYSLKEPTGDRQSVIRRLHARDGPRARRQPVVPAHRPAARTRYQDDARLLARRQLSGRGLVSYVDPDHVYSFNLVDVEGVQHIPLLRETWVVSLRARVQTTVDDDDVVPYFLMPSLGSSSTLRAYSTAGASAIGTACWLPASFAGFPTASAWTWRCSTTPAR